ncbi:hypothetical protein M1L60_40395 [Actinoplanes sp. TRM 88003]|uniref:Lipoprotein n=1 Tax=Paractinoplanes aksuensis TaxID=2939490 RepID=A0ABT1E162_9ACTN|nr:hypothetical protein [Actinoplanes aksuensis]MCO8276859.1 hypothetical protein [Actinoplanes aksuensis]
MLSARRTASALVAAIAITTLAACSDDITGEGPGPIYDTGPPGSEISDEFEATLGPKITLEFDITGAVTVKGKATATAPSGGRGPLKTCAEYAQGSAERYTVAGELDEPVGAVGVAMDMFISGYAGPGPYPKNQLAGASGPSPYIAVEDAIYSNWSEGATARASTDSKGGGSWTFTNVKNRHEASAPDDTISGTVTWTCRKR